MKWDVFVSHASEDKDAVARPLAELLRQAGMKVWLDENELTVGDSLSRKIDEGLAESRYGVVILSRRFFGKAWPPQELSGLVARQVGGPKVILPVWHEIDKNFILRYSPTLADSLGVSTQIGLERVATELLRAMGAGTKIAPKPKKRSLLLGIVVIIAILAGAGLLYHRVFAPNQSGEPSPTVEFRSHPQ